MPELNLGDFTAATDGLTAADLLHIQRNEGGVMTDYQQTPTGLFGVPVRTYYAAGIGTGPTGIISAPGAGKVHIFLQGYGRYNPGVTNDNAGTEVISIIGSLNAAFTMATILVPTHSSGGAGGIVPNFEQATFVTSTAVSFTSTNAFGVSGTFDLWLQYFVAEWP